MTADEFRAWLGDEVVGGRMKPNQLADMIAQQTLFIKAFGTSENPEPLRREFYMKIVGYVAGQLRSGSDIHDFIENCLSQFPGRMIYFEPIGFDLL